MRRQLVFLGLALALLAACRGKPPAPSAVPPEKELRPALDKYLASRSGLNLPAMDIEIKKASVQGNAAEALVEFRTKDGQGSMQMTYTFERQGHEWVVKGAKGSSIGTPESETAQPGKLPAGHPPPDSPAQPPKRP